MPRKVKSQWEFGDLFEAGPERKSSVPEESVAADASPSEPVPVPQPKPQRRVWEVREITEEIRDRLEGVFSKVWVSGEITNLRRQASGHLYFTLKDARAQISCVLFRGVQTSCRDDLEDGTKVILGGGVTVYEPRGQYQLKVTSVELHGVGALQRAFEQLKRRLDAEGLFDPDRKRPLPAYLTRVGLVTSPTGAAIRDIVHVIQRRDAGLRLILVPVRVQGEGAALEIADAVERLNAWSAAQPIGEGLEAILLARGGGSLEDLWAFNEEPVARAIAASVLPVVSAVGHEIDFTIADFAADVRAATPSAGAEILTADVVEARAWLEGVPSFLKARCCRTLDRARAELEAEARRLSRRHPRRKMEEAMQDLDSMQSRLLRALRMRRQEWAGQLKDLQSRLRAIRPSRRTREESQRLDLLSHQLRQSMGAKITNLAGRVERAGRSLQLLSPQNVLDRGYSITRDPISGKVVRHADEVCPGQMLQTRLSKGEIQVEVRAKETGSAKENPTESS